MSQQQNNEQNTEMMQKRIAELESALINAYNLIHPLALNLNNPNVRTLCIQYDDGSIYATSLNPRLFVEVDGVLTKMLRPDIS